MVTRRIQLKKFNTSARFKKVYIRKQAAEQIVVIHVISGCETTSALYGIGKGRAWQQLIGKKEQKKLEKF